MQGYGGRVLCISISQKPMYKKSQAQGLCIMAPTCTRAADNAALHSCHAAENAVPSALNDKVGAAPHTRATLCISSLCCLKATC